MSSSFLLKIAAKLWSGVFRGPRLSILIFHRVLPGPDPYLPGVMHADLFDRLMSTVSETFTVLPLGEAIERLRAGALPGRALCVTFDDGYADNLEVALPILARYRIPATFFIATGYLDGGIMWNDVVFETFRRVSVPQVDLGSIGLAGYETATLEGRAEAASRVVTALKHLPGEDRARMVARIRDAIPVDLPGDLMLSSDQLRRLAEAGMEIGGHTVSHPILARIDDAQAMEEILSGRDRLHDITGRRPRFFAYPNGKPGLDYAARHVRMVREAGFSAALSTAWGVATPAGDPYQIPRFSPWDRSPARFSARLMANYLRTTPALA